MSYSFPISNPFAKPQPSEAYERKRVNGLVLVGTLIATTLLPTPSPWTAFFAVWFGASGDGEGLWYGLCLLGALDFIQPARTRHERN